MLGDRDLRNTIEKFFNKLYEDLSIKIDKADDNKIHALEAARCTRLSYYERKEPLPPDSSARISILLQNGMKKALNQVRSEYKIDNLTLAVDADVIIADEFVVRFEIVPSLPEIPHPQHMLYLNACLFAFNKKDGFIIYMTTEGKTVEFDITRNNRMFEEIVRRARVLSTLLKEGKVPIVEPSNVCLACKYYERCYSREKVKESDGLVLEELFGKRR